MELEITLKTRLAYWSIDLHMFYSIIRYTLLSGSNYHAKLL